MPDSKNARLRGSTTLLALGVLLLMIGNGAYRETLHWAKLFSDKPLLRFITYVGDRQGLGYEVRDISYKESSLDSGRTLSLSIERGRFSVIQVAAEDKEKSYNDLVTRHGSENVLRKGELLIPFAPIEDNGIALFNDFDEVNGPLDKSVVLRAVGSSYLASIERSIYSTQHCRPIIGLTDIGYDYMRLFFYRPVVALSYSFPMAMVSLVAYIPGLAMLILTGYIHKRNKQEGR